MIGEARARPMAYCVLAVFVLAGPAVAVYLFPQISAGAAVIGGLAFGAYAALCAVPQKFL